MKRGLSLPIILIVTALAYLALFQNQFVIDDKTFILNWEKGRSLSNIGDFFKGAVPVGHEGVYRPLRSVLYALYYSIWGSNPFGYHLHALTVHLASTALIYLIFENITKKRILAFAGGLLFGLHPIHVETIAYTAVSMEATGVVFFLASFLMYLKIRYSDIPKIARLQALPIFWYSVLFALLAFFTYEMTLTLPLLIVFYDLCFKKGDIKKSWQKYLPYFGIAVGYFLIRIIAIHGASRGDYLGGSIFLTFLAGVKVLFNYLTLTILPLNLMHNHIIPQGIEAILYRGHYLQPMLAQSIFDWEFLVAAASLFLLGLTAWKSYKNHPLITFGVGWFLITLLPVSNIIPQWSLMHEKFLYLPSFGLILAFIYLLGFIKKQLIFNITLFIISFIFSILTFNRVSDWKDSITLWQKDIQVNPKNAYAYFQLAEAYLTNGEKDKALQAYQKSFDINPNFAVAIASLARTYETLGEKEQAIEGYQKAIKADLNFWEGYYNLGQIYTTQGQIDVAQEYFGKALKINPNLNAVFLTFTNRDFSFSYPVGWGVERFKNGDLRIINNDKSFQLDLKKENVGKLTIDTYLKNQTESYGTLINQGLAQIPGFDQAYVKVFKDGGVDKMLFFLFKSDSVVKVLVYPSSSSQMRVFDTIIGSLKIVDK